MTILAASANVRAADGCGDLGAPDGEPPRDYRSSADKTALEVVERGHFTPEVESLTKGHSAPLGSDIDYTLRHFPNHHRALMAMAKLGLREKSPRAGNTRYSVECYFDRAMRFKPDDGVVRMIYGIYLSKLGNSGKAIEQLNEANKLQPDNANINYNLGMIYFQKKDYANARTYARKAYELGFPLPGLKEKLTAAGKWAD
ncbi:MAG: tetratricopeptide repeat protein [Sulfuricella sp.]|nr:tetratricopeptide repeat protein [Sulfuricella sp.]